jgi:hypothetical protein
LNLKENTKSAHLKGFDGFMDCSSFPVIDENLKIFLWARTELGLPGF